MTTTRTVAPDRPTTTAPAGSTIAACAAVLLAVALFMTVATINVPHQPADAALLAWWQDSGNRLSGLLSGMWAIVVAVSIPIVVNHIQRLDGTSGSAQWMAFARSMSAAVTAVWLVTGAARPVIAHLVDTMDEPLPGTDVLRYSTALNYTLLGESGMTVLALCMAAISVVVLRTRVLGRWLGYVGTACAAVMLAAVAAQSGAYATPLGILWAMCLAAAIWRGPSRSRS
jgi:hypothetical protein